MTKKKKNKRLGFSPKHCFGASTSKQWYLKPFQCLRVPASLSLPTGEALPKLHFLTGSYSSYPMQVSFIFYFSFILHWFYKILKLNRYFTRNPCSIASSLQSPYSQSSKVGNFLIHSLFLCLQFEI